MAVAPVGTAGAGQLATAGSAFTVTLATGLAVGDLDVIVTTVAGIGVTCAPPTGWTSLAATTDNNTETRAHWRIRQAGDPATVSMTISGGTSQAGWVAAGYTGTDQSAPFGTPVNQATTVAATTLNVAALTTTGTGSYRLVLGGANTGSTSFDTMPAGTTQVGQSTSGKRTVLAHAAAATPGTVAASSFTVSAAIRGETQHVEVLASSAAGSQTVVPASDVTNTGGWTNQAGASTGLYATLGDASDTTYAASPALSATAAVYETKLAGFTVPATRTGWSVAYRMQAVGAATTSVLVELVEGTTVRASETRTAVPAALTDYTLTLTQTQAAAITAGSDLRLRFTVTGS